jgi:Zn-dependent M28 family amino/carboxypeptidase
MKKNIPIKNKILWSALMIVFTALAQACTAPAPQSNSNISPSSSQADLKPALDAITSEDLLRHTTVLSSDEYEGRAPGTRGEDLTVNYLTEQFKRIGVKPGNPDGTYTQKVPLVGFTPQPTLTLSAGGKNIALKYPDDYIARSPRFQPEMNIADSDVVFVGYGVVAPEYGWDDYKGVDVKGKTIVMLINDPAIPDPNDPAKLDERMFKGKAMTYYGRWTYKYEIAAEKGAAAAIIVHETGPAGYPFAALSSWVLENLDIKAANNMNRVAVESWVIADRVKELFAASGQDFDAMKKAALAKDFKPVALGAKASFNIKTTLRDIQSNNIIGKIEGSDAVLKDEYVIYTAHWDHMGRDEKLVGDQIFNGALDNASGTAALIELAEAFSKLPTPPKRSILFMAVTAEEKGLLGAMYYANNPLYPLTKTLANINMDGVQQWGRTSDIVIIGYGNSTLDDLLKEVAGEVGRTIEPDPEPEKGFFYRSDHFEFAKQGVPALYTDSGTKFIGKPEGYSQQKRDEYTNRDYHKVSDEVKPDWDLSGAVEDTQLLFRVGYRVAQGEKYPEWKPGTEFKARREEMLNKK